MVVVRFECAYCGAFADRVEPSEEQISQFAIPGGLRWLWMRETQRSLSLSGPCPGGFPIDDMYRWTPKEHHHFMAVEEITTCLSPLNPL